MTPDAFAAFTLAQLLAIREAVNAVIGERVRAMEAEGGVQ